MCSYRFLAISHAVRNALMFARLHSLYVQELRVRNSQDTHVNALHATYNHLGNAWTHILLHTPVRCVRDACDAVRMRDAIARLAIVRRSAICSRTNGVTRSAVHTHVGGGVTHNVKSCLRCISWPHVNDRRSATSVSYLHPSAQSCARAPRATTMQCTCNVSTTTLHYGVAPCPPPRRVSSMGQCIAAMRRSL